MIGYSKTDQLGSVKKKSQTQKNQDANKNLDALYTRKGINYCEVQVSNQCLKKETESYGEKLKLTYAHRHKRSWYKSRPELLFDFNQTIRACVACHMIIEVDRKLSASLFLKLRGTDEK